MKNIGLILIVCVTINSCSRTRSSELHHVLEVDNSNEIIIVSINAFDCISCFGTINIELKKAFKKYLIPSQNRFLYIYNTRKKAQRNFLDNYVKLDSSFKFIHLNDENIIKQIEVVTKGNNNQESRYFIIDKTNKVKVEKRFKP